MSELQKVLIVDDDERIQELVKDEVRQCGFEPVSVKSTHDAIGILAVLHPMAMLLDLNLPQDPGDECCRVLKGNTDLAHIPVVFMTASTAPEDVRRIHFAGADDYLAKPVRGPQLRAKLAAIAAGLDPARTSVASVSAQTVLIADGDPLSRSVLGRRLERAGYWTAYARTGAEALEHFASSAPQPDLSIVDLALPGAPGGLEVLEKIRELSAAGPPPIIVVTMAERTPQRLSRLRALGVRAAIDKKTLSVEHVVSQVRAALFRGRDARTEPRAPFFRWCEFRARGSEEWSSGFSYDLSATGLAMRTLTAAEVGSSVELRVAMEAVAPRLTAKAVVAWSNPFQPADGASSPWGQGLKFTTLNAEGRVWIADYVARAPAIQEWPAE